jgi:predicted cupin superfamily sugar epimerase
LDFKIKSDEIWYFHDGNTVKLFCLEGKNIISQKLGLNPENDESPQILKRKETFFGAKSEGEYNYSLVSCSVSPGFDFSDFELLSEEKFVSEYRNPEEFADMLSRT